MNNSDIISLFNEHGSSLREPLIKSMIAALALLRDEMRGEVCSECLDLRKGFNAADRSQKTSPQGFGQKCSLPVLLRSLYSYRMQPSRSAFDYRDVISRATQEANAEAERIFGSNAVHQRLNQRFLRLKTGANRC